jgi:hypothetical protein
MASEKGIKGSKRRAHYTVRIAVRLCEHIALGHTLKEALAKEPLGPNATIFWRWLDEYPEFRERYERARKMQAHVHADRMLELAEDALVTPSKAAAIKVATDIYKWMSEIRDPAKYGAKVEHKLVAPPLKPEDLKAEIKRLETELGVNGNVTVVEDLPQKDKLAKLTIHETPTLQ